ncbi:hypothetical protein M422DRAFT_774824 [Sphaerobolus stellatus SS14]|nr:hypothetical protein M422DRAFT_774824 [Sphaerobolus stellatus SS14]
MSVESFDLPCDSIFGTEQTARRRALRVVTAVAIQRRLYVIEKAICSQSELFFADQHSYDGREMLRIYHELEDVCSFSEYPLKLRRSAARLVMQIVYLISARHFTGPKSLQDFFGSYGDLGDPQLGWKLLLFSSFIWSPLPCGAVKPLPESSKAKFTSGLTKDAQFDGRTLADKDADDVLISVLHAGSTAVSSMAINSKDDSLKTTDPPQVYDKQKGMKRLCFVKPMITLRRIKTITSRNPEIFHVNRFSGTPQAEIVNDTYQTLLEFSRSISNPQIRKFALRLIVEILCIVTSPMPMNLLPSINLTEGEIFPDYITTLSHDHF